MTQVIIKMTSSAQLILHGIGRFLSLLNNIFEKNYDAMLYIELIQNGLLFVFKSWESFEKLHTPLPPNYRTFIPLSQNNFLIDDVMDASQYPQNGVIITVVSEIDPIDTIFPSIQAYYQSIHPLIKASLKQGSIELLFKNYESMRYYVDILYSSLPESARKD